ncbi:MAG: hypothetical protein Kow0031_29860 [Anaerolineae bacterium]
MTDNPVTATQLLDDRPPNWEYRLAALWLREGLAGVDRRLADLKRGAIFRPSTVLTVDEFTRWTRQKMDDVVALAEMVGTVLTDDLTPACGEPGQPGDPARIRQAVDRLIEAGEHLVEWEIGVHFIRVEDDEVQAVKALMAGWAEDILRQLEQLPDQMEQLVAQAAPVSQHELMLTFTPPATVNEFTTRLRSLGEARTVPPRRRELSPFVVLVAVLVIGLAIICGLVGGGT